MKIMFIFSLNLHAKHIQYSVYKHCCVKFGFRKLVMVGDQEQLQATVTCNSARQLDYKQSLFERLISCLSVVDEGGVESAGNTPPMKHTRSPVLRLVTQYRMHPDIALWPNRFYS